jgi:hypothetical protein
MAVFSQAGNMAVVCAAASNWRQARSFARIYSLIFTRHAWCFCLNYCDLSI